MPKKQPSKLSSWLALTLFVALVLFLVYGLPYLVRDEKEEKFARYRAENAAAKAAKEHVNADETAQDSEEYKDGDFTPYTDIGVGTGIYVINRSLGKPIFTRSSTDGYFGKPCIRCFYATARGYYEVTYYTGSAVSGGKISQRLFDKSAASADR